MSYTDSEWADCQPLYKSRLSKLGGCLMVGTYILLAVIIAINGAIVRKLWHYSGDRNWRKADDE